MASKNISKNRIIRKTNGVSQKSEVQSFEEGVPMRIPMAKTVICPLNYRKYYSEQGLQELAADVKLHGVISPVTARPTPSGGYEVVVGERRYRAAKIARIKEIFAVVKPLTDEQVEEIQLSENIHREDPHPMNEAQGIGRMLARKMSIDDIAGRLNKSPKFVYSRTRLLSLIEQWQDIFLADKVTIGEAFEVAGLSSASQAELYESCCKNWQDNPHFRLYNLSNTLSRFKYDLSEAPFNIKDKKLVPEAGACTACSFNTATLKTLFPDYAKKAVCSNKACYKQKCVASFMLQFSAAYIEHKPDAILLYGTLPEELVQAMEKIGDVAQLPQFTRFEVETIEPPNKPEQENYMYHSDDDDEAETYLDEEEYNQAIEDYQASLEEFETLLQSGILRKGLLVGTAKVELALFTTEKRKTTYGSQVTSKQVQEAIKAGTATSQLLEQEINRINNYVERQVQLTREKVQLAVHAQFTEHIKSENTLSISDADRAGIRLLIYQSLEPSSKRDVEEKFFGNLESEDWKGEKIYRQFAQLTDEQLCYMVRKALAGKSDSKLPNCSTGYFLYQMAAGAGVNIADIEKIHQEQFDKKKERQEEKVKGLKKRIEKLLPAKTEETQEQAA